jgi:hypothetical protein
MAWAIVMGYKDVENRTRHTSHRGPLLIHAGQRLDPLGFQMLWELGLHRKVPYDLPRGALVGLIRVLDCIDNSTSPWAIRGSRHWILREAKHFKTPLPCRGAQGFFFPDVSPHALGQARRYAVAHRPRDV